MLDRSIPMEMLKDNISIKTYIDDLGVITYSDEKVINNVRVQLDYNFNNSPNDQARIPLNLVFVDVKNSTPFNLEDWKLQSQILFKDSLYTIKKIEFIDDEDELHHLEVTI